MYTSTFNRKEPPFGNHRFVFLVMALGVAIRLFAWEYTYVINSDGIWYIHQARALYFHELNSLYNCYLDYLSIYSRLIALFYPLTGDFLFAAKTVSFLMGCLTLIPVYLLSRHFFSVQISSFVTLIFALSPVFVARSADVVRGPVCWFFFAWGLLGFIQYIDYKKWRYLVLSLACFLLSIWARIEAIVSLPSIILFLFIVSHNKKRVLAFLGSAIIICSLTCFWLNYFHGISVLNLYRMDEVTAKFSQPYQNYKNLRESLVNKNKYKPLEYKDHFIENARHQVHFVALGTLISNTCEAFFYPFLIFFILGFLQIGKKLKTDPRLWIFVIMGISGFSIVFIHVIQYWMIEYRYLASTIIATSVFAGFGIDQVQKFLSEKFHMKPLQAMVVIFVFIMIFGLSKNLKTREKDKYILSVMGETIAQISNKQPVIIASLRQSPNCDKIAFYANRYYEGAPCPLQLTDFVTPCANNYSKLVHEIHNYNADYFLWEDHYWPDYWFDFNSQYRKNEFVPIMRSKQNGKDTLVLYQYIGQSKMSEMNGSRYQ